MAVNNGVETIVPDGMTALQFAERGSLYKPQGETGLLQWGGFIQEEITPKLAGTRWLRVVREMLHNPTIKGMVFAVEMPIRRAEWMMEPAADGGNEAQEVADFIESARLDMRTPWEDTLAQSLSFIPYGYSLFEIVLKRRLGDEGNPASSSDDGLIGWDEWSPRSQDSLERWVFDDFGHVVAFVQQTISQTIPVTIPLSRCLHFRAGGYKGSPEGESALRAAYVDWDAIGKLQLIEAIGIERDLAGLPVALVPPRYLRAAPDTQEAQVYNAVKAIVTGVRQNDQAGVIFPLEHDDKGHPTFEFKLLSAGGQRQFDTSAVISRRTTQMARAMLADFITLGQSSTGSYALSKTKTDLFTTAISAWLDLIANVINDQAIKPLIRLNGIDSRLTPTLRPGPLDEADLKATGDYIKSLQPMLGVLNTEDNLSLLSHLFDVADFPAITTTAQELDEAAEEAAAQAEAIAGQQQEEDPTESEEVPAEAVA